MSLIAKKQTSTEGTGSKFVGTSTGMPINGGSATADSSSSEESANETAETDATVETAETETSAETSTETTVEASKQKVVGHGGKEIPPEAVSQRIERERRKLLRELTGKDVSSIEEAKAEISKGKMSDADKRELERLKRLEETRKRARLTNEQRVTQDLQAKEAEIAELKEQIRKRDEQVLIEQQDKSIAELSTAYIEPSMFKYAKRDLAEHLNNLQESDPEKFAKFGKSQMERWFQTYAKSNPQFAKKNEQAETKAKPTESAKVVRKVVTTSKNGNSPPPKANVETEGMYKGKTVKPGLPNSMNKAELREYARVKGVRLGY